MFGLYKYKTENSLSLFQTFKILPLRGLCVNVVCNGELNTMQFNVVAMRRE